MIKYILIVLIISAIVSSPSNAKEKNAATKITTKKEFKKSSKRQAASTSSEEEENLFAAADKNNTPLDPNVKKAIYKELKKVTNLCQYPSLKARVKQLNQSLLILRNTLKPHLEYNYLKPLKLKDQLFVKRVYHNLAKIGVLSSQENIPMDSIRVISVSSNFLHNYRVMYNLDPNIPPTFYKDWEKNVYTGLKCIK